jgi:catechol 2,3-dioxygenase-like lactoylglutathione lyase family enzyme
VDQRLSFVTIAVADRAASRRFYVDGLGWTPVLEADDVVMFEVAPGVVLSLWTEQGFEAEVGPLRRGEGIAPVTLAHNVRTTGEVDRVLDQARAAGAGDVTAARHREWGGYSGYFADPDGFRWEVAWNPGGLGLPPG